MWVSWLIRSSIGSQLQKMLWSFDNFLKSSVQNSYRFRYSQSCESVLCLSSLSLTSGWKEKQTAVEMGENIKNKRAFFGRIINNTESKRLQISIINFFLFFSLHCSHYFRNECPSNLSVLFLAFKVSTQDYFDFLSHLHSVVYIFPEQIKKSRVEKKNCHLPYILWHFCIGWVHPAKRKSFYRKNMHNIF